MENNYIGTYFDIYDRLGDCDKQSCDLCRDWNMCHCERCEIISRNINSKQEDKIIVRKKHNNDIKKEIQFMKAEMLKDVDSISTINSGILDIEVENNTVTVTNFDFAENYVATDKDVNNQDVYRGKKLVLEVVIQPSDEFDGNNITTNEPTSGIYVPDENGDYVATKIFDVPSVQTNEEWGENVEEGSYSGIVKLIKNTTINGKTYTSLMVVFF